MYTDRQELIGYLRRVMGNVNLYIYKQSFIIPEKN
jgi:hypothetical protein